MNKRTAHSHQVRLAHEVSHEVNFEEVNDAGRQKKANNKTKVSKD